MEYSSDGDVYVLSINLGEVPSEYGKILRYDDNGNFKGEFISYVGDARAITFGPDNNLYVFVMGKVKSYIGPNKPGAGTLITNFTLTGSSLPPGLMPSANGVISGTPTTTGNDTFTITVTDKDGCTTSQDYTLTIHKLIRFNYKLISWPYIYIYDGDPPPPGPWEIIPGSIAQVLFESDVEQLRYEVTELPRNGTIKWESRQLLNYIPNGDFVGTDHFTVKVLDSKGVTRNLAISITVVSREK